MFNYVLVGNTERTQKVDVRGAAGRGPGHREGDGAQGIAGPTQQSATSSEKVPLIGCRYRWTNYPRPSPRVWTGLQVSGRGADVAR
jgi:hypothetical protein